MSQGDAFSATEHAKPVIASSQALHLEQTLCSICQIDDAEPVAVGEDFEYRTSADSFLAVRCRRCGLVYLDPRPSTSDFETIYPPTYHANNFDAKHFGWVYRVRRELEKRRLRAWLTSVAEDAAIVDVGCGDGFHLDVLRAAGFQNVRGIDASERAVARARDAGLDVTHALAENDPFEPQSIDVALIIQTIEHVVAPRDFLASVQRMLRPGGLAFIVTDNTSSADRTFFAGRHWGGYHFPRHLTLFNHRTLAALSERAGFRVRSLRTMASPVNWTYSVRNLLVDYGAPAAIYEAFSLRSVPALAAFTLLDSAMVSIGRGALLHAVLERL